MPYWLKGLYAFVILKKLTFFSFLVQVVKSFFSTFASSILKFHSSGFSKY